MLYLRLPKYLVVFGKKSIIKNDKNKTHVKDSGREKGVHVSSPWGLQMTTWETESEFCPSDSLSYFVYDGFYYFKFIIQLTVD